MLGAIIKRAFHISIGLSIIWMFYRLEAPNVDRPAGIGLGIVWLILGILINGNGRPFRLPAGWPDWIALVIPGIYILWVALRTNWHPPAQKDLANMILCLVSVVIYAQPWLVRSER